MIESARLILRPFELADAEAAFEWLGDPQVMQFIPYGPDHTIYDSKKRIGVYIEHFERYGYSKYIIFGKESGLPIGDCGIMNLPDTPYVELGFRLKSASWGKGYATEAGRAVLNDSFGRLSLAQMHAIVEPENSTSIRFLEEKLKFVYIENRIFFDVNMRMYCLNAEGFR